jgi:hypothetical protein
MIFALLGLSLVSIGVMRRAGRDGQPAPLGEFLDVRVAAGPAAGLVGKRFPD